MQSGSTLLAKADNGRHGPDMHLNVMNIDYHQAWQAPLANSFTFGIGHMRPRSRGSVRRASADPAVAPLVDPAYLDDPFDLAALIEGVETVDRIVRTGAFGGWGGESQTADLLKRDRRDLEHAIKDAVSSYFHLAGTCRMGTDSDAVVDPGLRVNGVEGLWVADASVMPVNVTCNTNAATIMIGEKAADLLLGRSLRADA
jgi:choline dehydrogenase